MANQNRYYYNLKRFNISPRSTIDGRWKLVRIIGKGGNGEVWQCRDVTDKKEYAIKFLRNANNEPYSRFYDEVHFMESFGDVSGLMPIVAKYIPPIEDKFNKECRMLHPIQNSAETLNFVVNLLHM